MAGSPLLPPPIWTEAELRSDRDDRERAFRESYQEHGPEAWSATCAELLPQVEVMFEVTDDLRQISADLFRDDPEIWQLLRYVCAPILSEENFWTLVGSPKSKKVKPEYADAVSELLALIVDPVRFPWVKAQRDPTELERYAGVLATVVLLAAQRVGTGARGDRSKSQEALVGDVLIEAGYERVENAQPVNFIDDIARGTFTKERRVAGAKCDVPARLRDGRLLLIECKVSFGPKNGWKRLNRETGGKAEGWRSHFGNAAVVTAVVLDGVFDLGCLAQAQERQGVTIFWEHRLSDLGDFLTEVG